MTPSVALLTIGDGRDYLLKATLASLEEALEPDCGGAVRFATRVHVDDRLHKLGFGGAIREGWRRLREEQERTPFDYVLHVEEDWRFDRRVPLRVMAMILDRHPTLAQVALLRGPVNDQERAAGGLYESWPGEYAPRRLAIIGGPAAGRWPYLEHDLYFTTNPSLYRASMTRHVWPCGAYSERAFTNELLAGGYRFACLGEGEPWITHTGTIRTGTGY